MSYIGVCFQDEAGAWQAALLHQDDDGSTDQWETLLYAPTGSVAAAEGQVSDVVMLKRNPVMDTYEWLDIMNLFDLRTQFPPGPVPMVVTVPSVPPVPPVVTPIVPSGSDTGMSGREKLTWVLIGIAALVGAIVFVLR